MAATIELERIMVRLVGDASQYQRMLTQATMNTEAFARNVDRISTVVLSRLGIELGRVSARAVGLFSGFNLAMTEASSIMENTPEQTKKMTEAALELSTKGKFGPTELAKAYYELASAGMNAEQAIKALPAMQSFAIAGNMNLARATELASGTLNALGQATDNPELNLQRMEKIMDVISKANNMATGTAEQFARAMTAGAASSMHQMNIPLEEGMSILINMSRAKVQAELAGNAFQRLILLTTNAANRNQAAWQFYKFDAFDKEGNLKNMGTFIEDLTRITQNMSPKARGKFLSDIGFEARIQKPIIALLGKYKQVKEDQKTLIESAGGTTATVQAKQMEAFANQVAMLSNTFQVFIIRLVTAFEPAMREVVRLVSMATSWFAKLDTTTLQIIGSVVMLSLALVGLVLGIKLIGIATAIFMPWAYWLGIIAVLSIPIAAAITGWVRSVGGLAEAWAATKQAAIDAWAWLTPVRYAAASLFETIGDAAAKVWMEIEKLVAAAWKEVFGDARVDWEKVLSTMMTGMLLLEYIIKNSAKAWEVVQAGIKYASKFLEESFKFFFIVTLPELLEWGASRMVDVFLLAVVAVGDIITITLQSIPWRMVFKGMALAMAYTASIAGRIAVAMLGSISNPVAFAKMASEPEALVNAKFDEAGQNEKAQINGFKLAQARAFKLMSDIGELEGPKLTTRMVMPEEAELRKEFDRIRNEFMGSFEEWKPQRITELMLQQGEDFLNNFLLTQPEKNKIADDYKNAGGKAGADFSKELKHNMNMDAVLAGSAEDARRLQRYYQDVLDPMREINDKFNEAQDQANPGVVGPNGKFQLVPDDNLPNSPQLDKILTVNERMVAVLERIANMQPIEFQDAGLG